MTEEIKKKLASEMLDYIRRNNILSKVNTIWIDVNCTECFFRGEGSDKGMHKVGIDPKDLKPIFHTRASEKEHVSVISETDKYLVIYHAK
jgi:hypothetical protein